MTGSMVPGTLLAGRYRLDDLLAESGGARFWRATDTVLARSVAVHAVPSTDDRAEELLEAARVSATVVDQHLLRVLDCDGSGEVTWVVNEWGDGISLDLMLQQGTLPPARAAWLAREVAEGIAAGHAQAVCHGRLNPEAVMITHSGAVKLIGYVVDATLAQPRTSANYGELTEREADVIDLAGILYAALTGRWPGVSVSAVPEAPREGHRVLRARQVRAGVPRDLDTICDRVLNKDTSRHSHPIESAQEIVAALSDFVGDPATLPPVGASSIREEPTQAISLPSFEDAESEGAATQRVAPVPPDPTAQAEQTQQLRPPPPGAAAEEARSSSPSYEESPDRPLFASTERRTPPVAAPDSAEPPDAGVGELASTGPQPAAEFWPFAEEASQAPTGTEGRGWLRVALVIGLLVALLVGIVVAFNVGRRGGMLPGANEDTPRASGSPSSKPIAVKAAQDFDPESDSKEENPDDVAKAIDGDAATGWPTLTYRGNPELGGLKSGVGLILDLGRDRHPRSVRLRFGSSPTSFEVYAAPQGVNSAPSSLDQLDEVATKSDAGKEATVRLDPEPTTRFLVIWLTKLPPYPGGFRGEVNEVSVHS